MFVRPGVGGGVQLHSGAALLRGLGVDLGFAQPMRRIRTENQTRVHLTQRTHLTRTCLRSRAVDGSELLKLDLPSLMVPRMQVYLSPQALMLC